MPNKRAPADSTHTDKVQQPVQWVGGKGRIRSWVISHFPAHTLYVEPFGGSGAVLFGKAPSKIEVYNDLNSDLVNLFRVLQCPEMSNQLEERITLTLYSRAEFAKAIEILRSDNNDQLDRAWAFYTVHNMGFGGTAHCWCRNRTGSPKRPMQWHNRKERFSSWLNRLANVQIENSPAIKVIKYFDGPDTLFYLDPPYLHATRKCAKAYEHEMSDEQHAELIKTVRTCKGKVILSAYKSPMYDALVAEGWTIDTKEVVASLIGTGTLNGKCLREIGRRVEYLYINPAAQSGKTQERGYSSGSPALGLPTTMNSTNVQGENNAE